jgi:PAS domain S-box-containing protein
MTSEILDQLRTSRRLIATTTSIHPDQPCLVILTDMLDTLIAYIEQGDETIIHEWANQHLDHVHQQHTVEAIPLEALASLHTLLRPIRLRYLTNPTELSNELARFGYGIQQLGLCAVEDCRCIVQNYLQDIQHINQHLEHEIAQRKQAEYEREHFFNISTDLLVLVQFNGIFTMLNKTWEQVLGYTLEELQARPFLEFVHPDDREQTLAEFQECLNGKASVGFENRYLCKNGSYRWLKWNTFPFFHEQIIYAAATDITEQKHMEEIQKQQAISRVQVGQMLRDLQTIGGLSEAAMFHAGYELAKRFEATSVNQFLKAFTDMGLGKLSAIEVHHERKRWTFSGTGLVEVRENCDHPTCNYTRGFLCGAIAQLYPGAGVVGVEVACQSMGDEHCHFIIQFTG